MPHLRIDKVTRPKPSETYKLLHNQKWANPPGHNPGSAHHSYKTKTRGKGVRECIHVYISIFTFAFKHRHTHMYLHTQQFEYARESTNIKLKRVSKTYITESSENRCQGWPSVFCVSLKFHSIKLSPFFTWANCVTSFTTWHIETKCLSHHVHPYVTGSIVVEICTSLHKSSEH